MVLELLIVLSNLIFLNNHIVRVESRHQKSRSHRIDNTERNRVLLMLCHYLRYQVYIFQMFILKHHKIIEMSLFVNISKVRLISWIKRIDQFRVCPWVCDAWSWFRRCRQRYSRASAPSHPIRTPWSPSVRAAHECCQNSQSLLKNKHTSFKTSNIATRHCISKN